MYLIYGQKNKGERSKQFPLNAQIKFLSDLFDNKCWIFSMPGYLSKGENVENYLTKFNELIKCSGNTQYIGFGNGYHSIQSRRDYIEKIDELCTKQSKFYLKNYKVNLPDNNRHNHSKALFYFSWKDNNNMFKKELESCEQSLSSSNLCEFLKSIYVRAIIVGSSNQSFRTYFSEIADKGETDFLVIKSENMFNKHINVPEDIVKDIGDGREIKVEKHSAFFENSLIAKTLFIPKKYKSEQEYLNDIFSKCLNEELL